MLRFPSRAFCLLSFFLLSQFALHAQAVTPEQWVYMKARSDSFSVKTTYTPIPGDPLTFHADGYATTMCSAVFITGLDPEFAAEHVGYFTAPYAERARMGKLMIDRDKKTVSIKLPNGVVRTAVYTGGQGCVCYPEGKDVLYFKPTAIVRNLPDPEKTPWPMGDVLPRTPAPAGLDMDKVRRALDSAFSPAEAFTAAVVVTYKGRVIGEKYAPGITKTTPLESWSMGKSLSATIMGILMKKGVFKLDQPAPIPEWQGKGDGRAQILIQDIMHMSSGLYCRSAYDPDFDASLGYAEHKYLYTGGVNAFHYAASLPQQWLPNKIGRYRNSDPVLINYLNRLGIEKLGKDYHSFPQRELFDKIGIRTMVMETDPYGNFLTQGYELACARDWARLGNLYLQDGVWNGDRILPEGFTKFVSTLAPAWVADGRPIYGGLFWINGDSALSIPKDAYMMLGAGGQYVAIIPSHELVIVRLGHFKGSVKGDDEKSLNKACQLLMQAVPESKK